MVKPKQADNRNQSRERGVERILRVARRLFVRGGGAGFSARGVAKEAGVSLGAVQHFFRTKDDLLAATVEHVLGVFRREFDRLEEKLPFNPEARLTAVVDILIDDIWHQESRKFFFGLYSLGCHNSSANALLNEVYRHHNRRLAVYIGAACPHLDERECLDLALQISAMLDGLMIYSGPGNKVMGPRSRLKKIIRKTVMHLISGRKTSRTISHE